MRRPHLGRIPQQAADSVARCRKSDRTHALEEWMDTDLESNQLVKAVVLTTILAVAGMQ